MLIAFGAKPDGRKETVAFDGIHRREPEDLLSSRSDSLTDRAEPVFRIHNNEHTKSMLSERALGVRRESKLQIVFYFALPHRKALMTEVNFDESSGHARRIFQFNVSVRDETQGLAHGCMEREPTNERDTGNLSPVLELTVDLIYGELMQDKKVRNKQSVVRSPRAPRSDTDEGSTFF